MKKLGVNGKTFEEIFEERGSTVQSFEIHSNGIYLSVAIGGSGFMWIFEAGRITRSAVLDCCSIDEAGTFDAYPDSDVGYALSSFGFYEATTNQITLLNLYKSQS